MAMALWKDESIEDLEGEEEADRLRPGPPQPATCHNRPFGRDSQREDSCWGCPPDAPIIQFSSQGLPTVS